MYILKESEQNIICMMLTWNNKAKADFSNRKGTAFYNTAQLFLDIMQLKFIKITEDL